MVITSLYFLKRVSHRNIPVISIERKLFETCKFCIMTRSISSQSLLRPLRMARQSVQELRSACARPHQHSAMSARATEGRNIHSRFLKRTQGGKGDPAGERGGGGSELYCPFNTSPLLQRFRNGTRISQMGPINLQWDPNFPKGTHIFQMGP